MANALNMDLTDKVVVLDARYFTAAHHDVKSRLFRVEGGYGAVPYTLGKALVGTFLSDGERTRMEGYMVERIATEEDLA
jgi:hypothetical protein